RIRRAGGCAGDDHGSDRARRPWRAPDDSANGPTVGSPAEKPPSCQGEGSASASAAERPIDPLEGLRGAEMTGRCLSRDEAHTIRRELTPPLPFPLPSECRRCPGRGVPGGATELPGIGVPSFTQVGEPCPVHARRQPDQDGVFRCQHHSISTAVYEAMGIARARGELEATY